MLPSSPNPDALPIVLISLPRGIMLAPTDRSVLESFHKTKLGLMEEKALAQQFYTLNKLPKDIAKPLISRCKDIMAKDPQETAACMDLIHSWDEIVCITSLFIPRGGTDLSLTRGLLEIYHKTKLGQMEEVVFARRVFVLEKLSSNIIDNLMSQCRTIMAQDPEEKAACDHVIECCKDMIRITKSPHVSRTSLLAFPLDIRNGVYDMVIGNEEVIVHQCTNATQKYVTCPTGSCRAAPTGDICSADLKDMLAIVQTCQQVRAEVFKVLYTNRSLYFSCTCVLALCLGKNHFVRAHVQSIRLHLRGDQTNTAVSLLSSCSNLKRLEITVSKDTKVYSTADDRKDRTSPRQPDGFIIRKLEEVRGVSGLLELGALEEIEAKDAPGVVGIPPSELKRLDSFLKAGLAARRAELAQAEAEEAAKSVNAEVDEATIPLSRSEP